jgi:hypothetical protein
MHADHGDAPAARGRRIGHADQMGLGSSPDHRDGLAEDESQAGGVTISAASAINCREASPSKT